MPASNRIFFIANAHGTIYLKIYLLISVLKDDSGCDLSDYDNNEVKKPGQESRINGSSVDVKDSSLTVKVGSLVEIEIMGKKEIGTVRWIGETGTPKYNTAGLEMVS